jgi:hypothetical protein
MDLQILHGLGAEARPFHPDAGQGSQFRETFGNI